MKKFLSLLLAAMMIFSVLPTAALADGIKTLDMVPVGEVSTPAEEPTQPAEPAQPAEQEQPAAPAEEPAEEPAAEENEAPVLRAPAAAGTVKVYATVAGITFKNANDEAVSAAEEASGEYIAYVIDNASGVYTYSAEGYGTGIIKASGGDEIYLRVVDYALKEAGGSTFKMRVVNTKDSELVYTSEEGEDSVKLLIPALGYNVCYRAHFEPTDDSYASFEMNLWVLQGIKQFAAFKSSSFNLSDDGTYRMGKKVKVTFNVPQGAKLKVQQLVKFYRAVKEYPAAFVETKDGYDVYEAYVSDDNGGVLQYEVTKDGFAKTADIFKANAGTVTVSALKENSSVITSGAIKENSLVTNINARKFLELEVGEAKDLWFSRAWQAVDQGTSNEYVDPENHFYILEGDSVKIDEYGVVTGIKKGVSVIAMTYDALEYCGQTYKAVDPDKIAVFVVSVGGSSEGIDNGIDISDFDTFYIVSSLKIDGVGEVKANSSYKYTFTPKAESGEEIKVAVANVYGYPTPAMSAWKEYSRNGDGSFTVELRKGRNIVRIKAGSAEDYYVLNANETDVTIENLTAPGNKIEKDETVRVSYSNLITPMPKLGAVYNPGYPDTVYLIGEAKSSDPNAESIALEGPHTQYGISASSRSLFEFKVKSEGKIAISDVKIHLGAFGSRSTAHYMLGIQSEGGTYDGGLSPEDSGLYCFFQDVEFDCSKHEHCFTKEVVDEKYLAAPATETEATYYKSCVCGEKGTETFTVKYLMIKTGSKTPTNIMGCALESIKLIGSGMKLLPGYTETEYTIELPADTDKTKPLTIEMKGLLAKAVSGKPISRTRYFWIEMGDTKIKSEESIYEISKDCQKPAQMTVLPEWDANDEAVIEVGLSTQTGLHPAPNIAKFIKVYKLNLKIHKHSFVNEIVDEKYLASAADCENAALYYKSCDCGAHGEETFAYGEKLGHDLSKITWNTKEHWKKCLRCGKLLELEGHTYTDWTEGVDGKEHHHCTVCGFEQTATTIHIGGSGSKAPLSEQNPNTGAPVMSMAPAALVLAAAALVLKKRG